MMYVNLIPKRVAYEKFVEDVRLLRMPISAKLKLLDLQNANFTTYRLVLFSKVSIKPHLIH